MPPRKIDNTDNNDLFDELENKHYFKLKTILKACNAIEEDFGIDCSKTLKMFNILLSNDDELVNSNQDNKLGDTYCHRYSSKDIKKCNNKINHGPDNPSKIFCKNCFMASTKDADDFTVFSLKKDDYGLIIPFNYATQYISKYKYQLGQPNKNIRAKTKTTKYTKVNVKETRTITCSHELHIKNNDDKDDEGFIKAYKWSRIGNRFNPNPIARLKCFDEDDENDEND